jgi:hypothetical protein
MDDLEPMNDASWKNALSGLYDEDVPGGPKGGIDAGWHDVLERAAREDSESRLRRWLRPVRNWWQACGRVSSLRSRSSRD